MSARISAYLPGIDTNSQTEVRRAMENLTLFAARRRIAVVLIAHNRKAAAATAKLSMRLCPGQSPTHVLNVVSEHLRQRVPPGLKLEIANAESHGPGIRLPLDSPLMQIAADVLERMGGEPPAILWEGGSIPVVAALWEQTGAAPLLVGFGCGEDRVHAPNESFSLTQFREALRFSGLFLSELAAT